MSDDYGEKEMKIKFNSNDELNKNIEIRSMIIVTKGVFHENKKY